LSVEAQTSTRRFGGTHATVIDELRFLEVWIQRESVLLEVDWLLRGAEEVGAELVRLVAARRGAASVGYL
jgi:hypothetical protein